MQTKKKEIDEKQRVTAASDLEFRMTLHERRLAAAEVRESVCVCVCVTERAGISERGGNLGSSTILKKFNEPYAPS